MGSPDAYAAVALSGENAVAFLQFQSGTFVSQVVTPLNAKVAVQGPYSVAACGSQFVVTSPSTGSIIVIQAPSMALVGAVNVGPQPYSVACFANSATTFAAAVSTLGDNGLVLVDLHSLAVTGRVIGVAGSRGYHGIGYSVYGSTSYLWIAGTDQNIVTIVDPVALKIVVTFPVQSPTAIDSYNGEIEIASAGSNSILVFSASLSLISTLTGITSPQDLLVTSPGQIGVNKFDIGDFVASGPGNPLLQLSHSSPPAKATIQAATGAVALASVIGVAALATIPAANSIAYIQQQPNPPGALSIVNAASFQNGNLANGTVAPGSLATLFASDGANQNTSATAIPLPTSLAGVSLQAGSVTFSNTTGTWSFSSVGSVPLLFVGSNQMNFQVPSDLVSGSSVGFQLTSANGTTLVGMNSVVTALPGIFSLSSSGSGQAAVLNEDNTQNFATNPAARGSVIQIFATGAGVTNPLLAAGQAAPTSGSLVLTQVQPTVTIGGVNAPVQFSGLAPGFVGLWQINATVPMNAPTGASVALVISAGGQTSNTVTIAVQ